MMKFLRLSIVALTILFLFVGCRDDGSSNVGGTQLAVNTDSSGSSSDSVAVPEPATLLLLGSGLVSIVGLRRKVKK